MKPAQGIEEHDAIERGRQLYPRRPYPPRVYGYQWLPRHRVPDWAYVSSLESKVVTVDRKDRMGDVVERKSVTVFKVPLFPPREVHARHVSKANDLVARLDGPAASDTLQTQEELNAKALADKKRLLDLYPEPGIPI